MNDKEFTRQLIFPVEDLHKLPRGEILFLSILKGLKEFKLRLEKYRTNMVDWRQLESESVVQELMRLCPITMHACDSCPFQIEDWTFQSYKGRPKQGRAACALFRMLNFPSEMPTAELLTHMRDVVSRAEKYAEEKGWNK